MKVVFRTDGSSKIGMGHVMRCLALSEELTRRGNRCYFLSKIYDNILINKIKKFDVLYQGINSNLSLQEDLNILLNFSKENDIDWIITDHYGLDSNYVKEIKKNRFNVLSIDDSSQIHYYSDIVLNQNIGAEKLDFSAEKETEFLLSTKYAIIRDELLNKNKKNENIFVKKILIMLGGTDRDNLTLKILKVLKSLNNDLEFIVVLGPFNPFYNKINHYIKTSKSKIRLIKSPESMRSIYLESDIAISAGGTSCYELAYFGIPNIIVAIANNQINIAKELDRICVSIYIGKMNEIKDKELINKVSKLLSNNSLRKKMSENGKKIVDGKGKVRIVDFMEKFN